MLEDMRLAGLAPKTQERYVSAVVSLQKHAGGISPDRIPEKQVRAYLLKLRDDRNCARGTFQVHFHGLKFFYYRCLGYQWSLFTIKRVGQPKKSRLPVLTYPNQARAIIKGLRIPLYKIFAITLYVLGLRVEDAAPLTVHSIDSANMAIRVIGKGNKERILPLPPVLLAWLWQKPGLATAIVACTLVLLAVLGYVAERVAGGRGLFGAGRVVLWGALAMVATALIGSAFGVSV